MRDQLHIYIFRDLFSPSGDTLVCVAEQTRLESFITKEEIERAFSGCTTYIRGENRGLWPFCPKPEKFLGVWGNRNTSRFRRFLRERAHY